MGLLRPRRVLLLRVASSLLSSLLRPPKYHLQSLSLSLSPRPEPRTTNETSDSTFNHTRQRGTQKMDGGGELQFLEVVEAQSQVVSGIKYYLKVLAVRNRVHMLFDSEMVVKPWLRSKQLLNFAPHGPK